MLPPRFRVAHAWQWPIAALLALAAVTSLSGRAWADPLYTDLDRDGVRDVVTIRRSPNSLQVWLSGSREQIVLRTRRPVLQILASDVDGDGRLDLVAADAASVHVWRRTPGGDLRRLHPRRHGRAPGLSNPTGIGRGGDGEPAALASDGFSPPGTDAARRPRPADLDRSGAVHAAPACTTSSDALRLIRPRAPPSA